MTQKELKKLHRMELLELLIEQTKRADALEEEVAELKAQLAAREIDIEKAGTLAEAAIKINEVLAAADAAAKQYLYNVQRITGNLPEEPKSDETESDRVEGETENTVEEAKPARRKRSSKKAKA
jgi:hypothetical protein